MLRFTCPQGNQTNTEIETDLLIQGILHKSGIDLTGYTRRTLMLHLQRYLSRRELDHVSELLPLVLKDTTEMEALVDALVVRSTAFFQDPEFYHHLRHRVLPVLRNQRTIRIWQIGCATGQETWSLAMLLAEEGLWDQTLLLATDINSLALRTAIKATYDLQEVEAGQYPYERAGGQGKMDRWFETEGETTRVTSVLRANVVFGLHDLVRDPSFSQHHLIICRNVLMYCADPQRQQALRVIEDSLIPWGFFTLGSQDRLSSAERHDGYLVTDPDYAIYQKRAVKMVTTQRAGRHARSAENLEETVTMPPVELTFGNTKKGLLR